MPLQSPGYAATNALDEFMLHQEQLKQQQFLNSLAMQREARQAKADELYMQEARAALEEKKVEHEQKIKDRERDDTVKDVANMVPGDIPDADLVERARKHHIPLKTVPQPVEPLPESTSMQTGAPVVPQAPPESLAEPVPQVYAGDRKQQEAEQHRQAIRAFARTLPPGSAERKGLEYESYTDKNAPAGMFKDATAGGGGIPVVRTSPDRSKVEMLQDGKWVPVTGPVPEHAHFLSEPQPKDTSAKDRANEAAVQRVRESGYKDVENLTKPLRAQIDAADGLNTALSQNTNVADAVIAPMVLKATVSGTSSGFRMTQPEIDSVLKGSRTTWDNLKLTLNKWANSGGIDPKTGEPNDKVPLILDEDQKTAIRKLAKSIRAKALKQYKRVTAARSAMDGATTVGELDRIRTKLMNDVVDEDPEAAPGAVAGKDLGADWGSQMPKKPGSK